MTMPKKTKSHYKYISTINERDTVGFTALEYAVFQNKPSLVVLLLAFGNPDDEVLEEAKKRAQEYPDVRAMLDNFEDYTLRHSDIATVINAWSEYA